jgi:GT2 family glycosyltransferase
MSESASQSTEHVLVVTGMHRSGTSFAASLVHAAGLFLGERLLGADPSNPCGHFEDLDFLQFHQRALAAHGHADHGLVESVVSDPGPRFRAEAARLVADRRRLGRMWGWKEPRTVLFLDFWESLLPDARFLFVFRPPWEVIDSLYRRGDAVFSANPPFALRTWMHANRIIRDFTRRHAGKVLVREVSQLAMNPTEALATLRSRFGIPLVEPATTFRRELLSPAAVERVDFLRAACPECVDLLADLRELAGCPEDRGRHTIVPPAAVLDHGLCDWQWVRHLERELRDRTADNETTTARAITAEAARGTEAEAARALAAEASRAAEVAAARLVEADAKLAASDERCSRLQAAHDAATEEIASVRADAARHEADAADARRQLTAMKREHGVTITAQRREHDAELTSLRREHDIELTSLRREHDRVLAELAWVQGMAQRLEEERRDREALFHSLLADHAARAASAAAAESRATAELEARRLDLAAAHAEVASREARITALEATVESLRGSTSWRVTAPLRALSHATREVVRRAHLRERATRGATTIAAALRFVVRRLASPAIAMRSLSRGVEIVRSGGFTGLIRALQAARRLDASQSAPRALTRTTIVRMPLEPSAERPTRPKVTEAIAAPLVSVLLPVFETPAAILEATIQSLLDQTMARWELIAIDDASSGPHIPEILARHAARDPRIRFHRRAVNGGISTATNDALARATGDHVALVDHDDLLEPEAIERCIDAIRATGADAVYTDQDTIDDRGRHVWTFHKPDWSPEYLRHVMYVGHLLVVRRSLAVEIGGFSTAFDGVQDFEFMLRLGERTRRIAHVPAVLYHWRATAGSLASAPDAKPGIDQLQARAVQAHLDRLGVSATAAPHERFPHRCVVTPRLVQFPTVSIVIPTKDRPDLIGPCLDSIVARTRYPDFEVVAVDTGTTDPRARAILGDHRIRVVPFTRPFNFSAAANVGAAEARGDIIVFLNNDTTVLSPDWLDHFVFHLAARDVGAVGPLLLYPDGSVQHAGVVLGARGTADHVMRRFPADADGYAGSLSCPREVSAVTGACLAIRRDMLERVGGWNEMYATHYQDVDLCLRLRREGLRCLFTPDVRLIHHESPSRGGRYDFLDRLLLMDTWRDELAAGDPVYPAACSLDRLDYSPCDPITEAAGAS